MHLSDFGVNMLQSTLQNGLPVFVFNRPNQPISLRVAFLSGSRFDPAGKEGLAHFAEHMIVSGSQKFPTKHDIGMYVEGLGATMNASTSADKMDVHVNYALNADTQDAVNLIDQFLMHARFESKSIELERGAIMAELAGKKSNPGEYIYRLWKQLAYQDTLLGRDTIGTETSLHKITQQDLRHYYQYTLEQNNCVVVASGDITAEELATTLNQTDFVKTRTFTAQQSPHVERLRTQPISIQQYPNTEQAHLMFGFPTVDESHLDFWPMFVLSRLLGAGRTARLVSKLRHDLGLVYSVNSGIDSWWGCGSMVITTSCKTDNTQAVLDAIVDELKLLIAEGVATDKLAHLQNYLTKMQLLQLQTSSSWVSLHINTLLKHPHKATSIVDNLANINAVTPQQIHDVAQKYLRSDSWYLAVCGNISADNISINF